MQRPITIDQEGRFEHKPIVRRKIRIRLPKVKVEPEQPPRMCVLCETERSAWHFIERGHPDICHRCWVPPERPAVQGMLPSYEFPDGDRQIMASARSVIRRLQNGA